MKERIGKQLLEAAGLAAVVVVGFWAMVLGTWGVVAGLARLADAFDVNRGAVFVGFGSLFVFLLLFIAIFLDARGRL